VDNKLPFPGAFFFMTYYDFRYGFENGFAPFGFLTPFPKPLLVTKIKMLTPFFLE